MTLFFSICIYVHTRSTFNNTSCLVIITSGWYLRWRHSHAYLDSVCFSDEATFHACGDINNQIKITFQMSCYIQSFEKWIFEGQERWCATLNLKKKYDHSLKRNKFHAHTYNTELNFRFQSVIITLAKTKLCALPIGTVWVHWVSLVTLYNPEVYLRYSHTGAT
jgi:hypothetical protein